MHGVLLELPEGSGGCAGHWPGWYSTLSPGPAPRKLLRSSENELWCRKPGSRGAPKQVSLECISRRRLQGKLVTACGERKTPRGTFLQ